MVTPRNARPDARERILAAADRLFYRDGIRAVGIDTVIAEAGVAKATLYAHFKTKDDLIVGYLQRRDLYRRGWVRDATARYGGGVAGLFAALGEWFTSPEFRGCAFLNAAAELPDPAHPGRRVVADHQRAFAAFIAEVLAADGVSRPDTVAPAVFLLIEGAIVVAAETGEPVAADLAHQAAKKLLAH